MPNLWISMAALALMRDVGSRRRVGGRATTADAGIGGRGLGERGKSTAFCPLAGESLDAGRYFERLPSIDRDCPIGK
jgi:hypothetical protein